MNPPTPGHLHLIDTLVNIATTININKVYLILSKTHDCDNPLTCEEKKVWLSKIIVGKSYPVFVQIVCVEDMPGAKKSTPFTPITNLIYNYKRQGTKNINLIMVLGSDRVDMLENITDQYYFKDINVKTIDKYILERDEDMENFKKLEPTELLKKLGENREVPIESMSASLIRKIVSNDWKDIFEKIYEKYLSLSDINSFYENIYTSLKDCIPPSSKKKSSLKTKGYTYPMVKANPTEIGGKTNKRKTNKRKTNKRKINKRKTNKRKTNKRKNIIKG
jgi:nicotinic acid mononucleotide adenylyltransferase